VHLLTYLLTQLARGV